MAVSGFSIFLGFFPIFTYVLIFIILFSFRKHRAQYGTYYDAMFSGAMSLYLMLYYIAFNYSEDPTEQSDGKRNLWFCILVVVALVSMMVATLSWMFAGSFWMFLKAKSDAVPPVPPQPRSDILEEELRERGVTFDPETDETQRRKFHRQLNNNIILVVTVATVALPVLYIFIDIFGNSNADLINYDHKCWIGGSGGPLMYIMIYIPALVAIATSIGFNAWCGMSKDRVQFCSSKPTDLYIRNTQLRIVLISGLGVWWMIEIPALTTASPTAVQLFNGLINIPLSVLAYYILVYKNREVLDTWDKACPLGKKVKKEIQQSWKYYVYRPVRKQIYVLQNKYKHRNGRTPAQDPSSSILSSPIILNAEEGATQAEDPIQQATHYNGAFAKDEVEYQQEFQDPNIYENAGVDLDMSLVISEQPVGMESTAMIGSPVASGPVTDVPLRMPSPSTPQYDNVPDKVLAGAGIEEVEMVVIPSAENTSYDMTEVQYDNPYDTSPTYNDPTTDEHRI